MVIASGDLHPLHHYLGLNSSTTIGIRDSPLRGREIERHGRYNCSTIILEMTELKWISFQQEPRDYPI